MCLGFPPIILFRIRKNVSVFLKKKKPYDPPTCETTLDFGYLKEEKV